ASGIERLTVGAGGVTHAVGGRQEGVAPDQRARAVGEGGGRVVAEQQRPRGGVERGEDAVQDARVVRGGGREGERQDEDGERDAAHGLRVGGFRPHPRRRCQSGREPERSRSSPSRPHRIIATTASISASQRVTTRALSSPSSAPRSGPSRRAASRSTSSASRDAADSKPSQRARTGGPNAAKSRSTRSSSSRIRHQGLRGSGSPPPIVSCTGTGASR